MSAKNTTDTFILVITGELDNRRYTLSPEVEYTIGRSNQADIEIADRKASRKHAVLTCGNDVWKVIDNGSTNGITVGGQKKQSFELLPDSSFSIGNTLFTLEYTGKGSVKKSPEKKSDLFTASSRRSSLPSWFVPVLTGLLGFVVILVCLAVLRSKPIQNKPSDVPVTVPDTATTTNVLREAMLKREDNFSGSNLSAASVKDKQRALEYYRAGLRFYDTGHLRRAIENWDKALYYDDTNTLVIKRLRRALTDLDYEINTHYQSAKNHLKYHRYHEAEQEFMIVTELAHDKKDERFVDSQKQLELIKNYTGN